MSYETQLEDRPQRRAPGRARRGAGAWWDGVHTMQTTKSQRRAFVDHQGPRIYLNRYRVERVEQAELTLREMKPAASCVTAAACRRAIGRRTDRRAPGGHFARLRSSAEPASGWRRTVVFAHRPAAGNPCPPCPSEAARPSALLGPWPPSSAPARSAFVIPCCRGWRRRFSFSTTGQAAPRRDRVRRGLRRAPRRLSAPLGDRYVRMPRRQRGDLSCLRVGSARRRGGRIPGRAGVPPRAVGRGGAGIVPLSTARIGDNVP